MPPDSISLRSILLCTKEQAHRGAQSLARPVRERQLAQRFAVVVLVVAVPTDIALKARVLSAAWGSSIEVAAWCT